MLIKVWNFYVKVRKYELPDLGKNKNYGLPLYYDLISQSWDKVIYLFNFTTHLLTESIDEVIHLLNFTIWNTIRAKLDNWSYDVGL